MEERPLVDLFALLWPDFSALWGGDLSGINALIVSVLLAIGAWFAVLLFVFYQRAQRRISGLTALVDPLDPARLVEQREDVRRKAEASEVAEVKHLWRELDETLVESADGSTLWNTLDAAHFLNSRTLAPELAHNRLLGAVPSILTAIGVLGTFIGLTTGLNGLELKTSSDIETLKSGIDTLIVGAAIAFMTSVWGVSLSLAANFSEKMVERNVLGKISTLEHDIDRLFKRHPPEQSLVKIMGSSDETALAVQELHERIGDKLQEAVRGVSDSLEEALMKAIETSMSPAMQSLVSSTSQQSTAVFEQLVDRFTEGFQKVGETQAQRLDGASSEVTTAIQSMSSQFEQMMSRLDAENSAQQDELAARSEKFRSELDELVQASAQQREAMNTAIEGILGELKDAGSRIERSGVSLERASETLATASTAFDTAASGLGQSFSTSVQKMEELAEQQESAASMFWEYANQLTALLESMKSTSASLESAAESSTTGFAELSSNKDAFIAALRTEFAATTNSLTSNVGELRTSMANWLADYSREVSAQVNKRMDDWNTQSVSYAENMLRVAQALSDAVDELEAAR